ncbi:MAG TPA: hypothetical protein VIL84_11530 [Devosiaceae bacterium]
MNKQIGTAIEDELQRLYKDDEVVHSIFDWFDGRQKDSREMPARVAADRTGYEYGEIIRVFRKFDELGIGTFLVGRRGSESRLQWHYSIKSLAEAAKNGAEVRGTPRLGQGQALEDEDDDSMFAHAFQLRSNLRVEISLPVDLTDHEANRIAAFVKTLPLQNE